MRLLPVVLLLAATFAPAAAWAQNCTRPLFTNCAIASEKNEPNYSIAHDLVFIGDGYTAADNAKWVADVTAYINELKNASSTRAMVTVDPTVFNYHRIDVVSETRDLADTDRNDTAFGSIATEFDSITYTTSLVTLAASKAPDVDTIVMLVNSPDGRSNAYMPTGHTTGGRLVIRTPSVGVFPHELGHAIFRLVDEYTESSGCYPSSEADIVARPNVTTERNGTKWARAGSLTPVEGNHLWTQCAWRARSSCLMRSTGSTPTWCPVCARHIQTQVLERRQGDLDPPYVAFSSPANNAVLTGSVSVSGKAWDSRAVSEIVFKVDGVQKARTTTTTLNYTWNTLNEQDGLKTLTLTAKDSSGKTETVTRTVRLNNYADLVAPSVSITSPKTGATVAGTQQVTFTATDNVAVTRIDLRVDGTTYSSDFAAPWSLAWQTTNLADGTHTLSAVAWDAAGNKGTSATVTVVVVNNRPDTAAPVVTVLKPAAGTHSGVLDVEISAVDDVGVVSSEILVDGKVVEAGTAYTWDTTQLTNGLHALQGRARDAAGNVGTSQVVQITVDNDLIPPQVTFVTPSEGAHVAGTVEVKAEASDDRGDVTVRLLLDGELLADAAEESVDTRSLADGPHVLKAEATDAAGNPAAAEVRFHVDNTPPQVSISAPEANTEFATPPVVEVAVEDASPIERVELSLNGQTYGVSTTAPFRFDLGANPPFAGLHALEALAIDAAGNEAKSAEVRFTLKAAPKTEPEPNPEPQQPAQNEPGASIPEQGCGCGSSGGGAMLLNAFAALVLLRRRR